MDSKAGILLKMQNISASSHDRSSRGSTIQYWHVCSIRFSHYFIVSFTGVRQPRTSYRRMPRRPYSGLRYWFWISFLHYFNPLCRVSSSVTMVMAIANAEIIYWTVCDEKLQNPHTVRGRGGRWRCNTQADMDHFGSVAHTMRNQ